MYEGGRPRGFCCWFMVGSDELLELEACGDRLVGRWVGVEAPGGVGDGLVLDFRFEPTSLFRPALMDDIGRRERGRRRPEAGCVLLNVRLEKADQRG